MRDIVSLACTECKRRNYSTTKNKKKTTDRLEFSKYCRFCRKHVAHRESEIVTGYRLQATGFRRRRGISLARPAACSPQPAARVLKANSSIGRAPVSKTGGWGFESLLACQLRAVVGSQLSERHELTDR